MVRHVLITGGGGFIGSHVAEYYADRDTSVTVMDNLSREESYTECQSFDSITTYNWNHLQSEYPEIEFVKGDLRDAELVEELADGCDGIVHTGGQVAVTVSLADPRTDFEANALGTFNVLEAARKSSTDTAVVFASTNKVYGSNVNEIPVRETESQYWYDHAEFEAGVPESLSIDGCTHTPYGTSKLAADLYVQDYNQRNEVNAAVFRMGCIYGPRQFGTEDQGWIAHFAISALRDDPITIYGNGKQVRDVLYVTDLVRAYDAFLQAPSERSGVYNIGGGPGHTTSLLEFLTLLEDELGSDIDISFEEWREGDQYVYVSDISRARDRLNWDPKIDFETGVRRLLDWLKSQQFVD
ncbi:NAD-dependent epimerase/dehydratase family protein [Natrialbaceae archaeon A-arb3/5]